MPRTDGTETLDGLTGAGLGAGESRSAEAVLASRLSVSSDADAALELIYTEFLRFLQAVVDGGRGHDVAHVTRNVRVANCEEIEILDEPR